MRARQLMANSSEVKMTLQNAFDESLARPGKTDSRAWVIEQVGVTRSGLI